MRPAASSATVELVVTNCPNNVSLLFGLLRLKSKVQSLPFNGTNQVFWNSEAFKHKCKVRVIKVEKLSRGIGRSTAGTH